MPSSSQQQTDKGLLHHARQQETESDDLQWRLTFLLLCADAKGRTALRRPTIAPFRLFTPGNVQARNWPGKATFHVVGSCGLFAEPGGMYGLNGEIFLTTNPDGNRDGDHFISTRIARGKTGRRKIHAVHLLQHTLMGGALASYFRSSRQGAATIPTPWRRYL